MLSIRVRLIASTRLERVETGELLGYSAIESLATVALRFGGRVNGAKITR